MFVWTLRMTKKELIIILIGAAVFIALCVGFLCSQPDAEETAASPGNYSLSAANEVERIGFLEQFGWECSSEAVYVEEVKIPETFSEEYAKYNEIQLAQGFDLSKHCGERVKLWKYEIFNYPLSGTVYASILIKDGKVIGGDISSQGAEKFTHGLDPNQNAAATAMAQLRTQEIDRSVPDYIPANSEIEPIEDE